MFQRLIIFLQLDPSHYHLRRFFRITRLCRLSSGTMNFLVLFFVPFLLVVCIGNGSGEEQQDEKEGDECCKKISTGKIFFIIKQINLK